MPYFVVYALDKAGGGAIRAAHRPAHRARLRDTGTPDLTVHIGGPMLDEAGGMIGSMLVVEAPDAALVTAFVEGDPYARAGLYETVNIHPYNWGLGTPQEARHG